MADNETIADIIAEMRDYSNDCNDGYHTDYGVVCTDIRNYADRLEAARKREKATAEKSSTVGDAEKLREALLRCDAIAQLPEVRNEQSIKDMRNIIRQALSAPPRNCDVGTAEEQTRRMEAEYCHIQKSCYESPSGRECPLHKAEVDCRLIWSQMPYKKGEGNER